MGRKAIPEAVRKRYKDRFNNPDELVEYARLTGKPISRQDVINTLNNSKSGCMAGYLKVIRILDCLDFELVMRNVK